MPHPQCYFTPGIEAQRKKLARFVLESDESAHGVARAAQDKLPEGGFGAYLSGDHARTRVEVQALYEALRAWRDWPRERPLCYEADPIETRATDAGVRQRVRLAPEVFATTTGTCLDLALVLAACLYYKRIYPVIVVTREHAFVGYWKTEHFYEQHWSAPGAMGQKRWPPLIDASAFSRLCALGHLGRVDAYGVASGSAGSGAEGLVFEAAEEEVDAHIPRVRFAVDIHAARGAGLSALDVEAPLPADDKIFPQRSEFERDHRFIPRSEWTRIVDEFVASHRHSGGYLLLLAGEGEGKSRFIADRVRMGVTPYHFVRYKHLGWDDPGAMLRSLRWQLWEKHGIDASGHFARNAQRAEAMDAVVAHAEAFGDQLQQLSGVLRHTGESELVYIDGLDEAFDATGRYHSTPGLPGILPRPLPLGICAVLTSRPGEHLVWLEQKDACSIHELKTPATLEANIADVKKYFKTYGEALTPPLDADYIDKAARRIEGNFYIARLKLDELLENPTSRVDPQTFPTTVNELHGQTCLRIVTKAHKVKSARSWSIEPERLVRSVLAWVALAPAPISINQLEAFGAPPESREVLGWAGSFFAPKRTVSGATARYRFDPEPDTPIRFDHASAQQWLTERLTAGERAAVQNALAVGLGRWREYGRKGMEAIRRYALAHLPALLLDIECTEKLADTLLDYGYLASAIGADGASGLARPIEPVVLARLYESAGALQGLDTAKAEALALIRQALDLALDVIAKDVDQLPSQMLGRLRPGANHSIDGFRVDAQCKGPSLKMCPVRPTLNPAGEYLIRIITGHDDWVVAVRVSADGRRVVSASVDSTLRVFDLKLRCCEMVLRGHRAEVRCFELHPDGRLMVSGSMDRTLRIWDMERGCCEATLEGHTSGVTAVVIHPDGRQVVSASDDNTLRVWNLDHKRCEATLEGHTEPIRCLALHPDGRRVVSGSSDGTLRVWDLASKRCEMTLMGHTACVTHVVLHPDGRRAVSGSSDNALRVWDLDRGCCEATLEGHQGIITAVVLHPDGRRAVSSSRDATLRVWNLESTDCEAVLLGHKWEVWDVVLGLDGHHAVSASGEGALRVWDLGSGICKAVLVGHTEDATSVILNPATRSALSASKDGTVRIWNIDPPYLDTVLDQHARAVTAVRLHPNGKHAISGSWDGTLRVWDTARACCEDVLEGRSWTITALVLHPDGRRAVTGSHEGTIRVWHLDRRSRGSKYARLGTIVKQFLMSNRRPRAIGHEWGKPLTSIVIYDDGRRAVSASDDTTLGIWDLERAECVRLLRGHAAEVTSVAVHIDGRRAVSTSRDRTLRVWDLKHGACDTVLEGHHGSVTSVVLHPDGLHAVSGSSDGTLRLWNLSCGSCEAVLKVHASGVNALVLHQDDRRVVSGSWDGTLRVWNLERGCCEAAFEGHTDLVTQLVLSPSGKYVLSASLDHTLRMWDLDAKRQVTAFSAEAPINVCAFTPDQQLVVAGDECGRTHFLKLV